MLRIGLNTGPAVVGKVGGADAGVTVLGDTVNFAARLQSLAEPNSVFMSDATYRLVQGLVDATFTGAGDGSGDGGVSMTTTLEKLLAEKQALLERLQEENIGPAERDEIERLLENVEAALQSLDMAWPGTSEP